MQSCPPLPALTPPPPRCAPTPPSAGNALGLIGVSGGILATLGSLQEGPATFAQVVGLLATGGLIGNQIASRIKITGGGRCVGARGALLVWACFVRWHVVCPTHDMWQQGAAATSFAV